MSVRVFLYVQPFSKSGLKCVTHPIPYSFSILISFTYFKVLTFHKYYYFELEWSFVLIWLNKSFPFRRWVWCLLSFVNTPIRLMSWLFTYLCIYSFLQRRFDDECGSFFLFFFFCQTNLIWCRYWATEQVRVPLQPPSNYLWHEEAIKRPRPHLNAPRKTVSAS